MTPEDKLHDAAGQWAAASQRWPNLAGLARREAATKELRAAALAYARPIVAEECARITEGKAVNIRAGLLNEFGYGLQLSRGSQADADEVAARALDHATAAIREHGKAKP